MKKTGRFFVFEGIDGCGKSTQLARLGKRLAGLGCGNVLQTCEPTQGAVGKLLRQMLSGAVATDPRVIAHLFATDRLDHVIGHSGLLSSLEQGDIVLCDRYYFSSFAYHSEDMPMEEVISANQVVMDLLKPTATIYMEVRPETAMERIGQNREQREIFENLSRLQATLSHYEGAFARFPEETVIRIDGEQGADQVEEEIWEKLSALVDLG